MLELLLEAHEEVRFVYRHFPLSFHDKAVITAEATEAAGAQGAYYEMHDMILANQDEWANLSVDDAINVLISYADDLDLDVEQFTQDLEDHTYLSKVQAHYQEAVAMQLPGTPSFIINGQPYPGGLSYDGLESFIEQSIGLQDRRFDSPPPQVIDGGTQYQATISTPSGDIVVELFADQAPANVNSFAFLAQEGWYDGITFAQVIPEFAAVSGDITLMVSGHPGYVCQDEILPGQSFDRAGLVGMINGGLNMISSHFFITLGEATDLDGSYTIIGEVVEGMEVLEGLEALDPSQPGAPDGEEIQSITIEVQ